MNNAGGIPRVFITPGQLLAAKRSADPLCIIDLSKLEDYAKGHVPGALHLDEKRLVMTKKPVGGLLPDDLTLSALFSELGITAPTWVVGYDDQGNSRAGRLAWTLEVLGHTRTAILDGGLGAWCEAGQAASVDPVPAPTASHYPAQAQPDARAGKAWILEHLQDPEVVFLDVRTPEEYRGEDVRSLRGGHIPGAINYNWLRSQDLNRHRCLRPAAEIRADLQNLVVTAEKQIVAYCQTHMRSSHIFALLRQLGFERLRGYPGAWSDWGNDPGMPIEK